ncbi:BZ3500_MvSof-1268-A1-R1_Chr5-2g07771 [Microbotryum saponariae]|uniref:BZ3500_MvSof-1268-A1-R1_Chr5-2g07771 protein n=1 Tax=Microbotryum saponariae TaxID=289078 RepID=A0A2X0L0W7_9BASI|nr:BZ3500_MvSof-1268-A1-R1_Chr5-2g07771 [Microbotryum saponariae]SDA05640.1 BZ3501_MvSof-1269-A2-R1_Chr5-2g07593 [Microbotryum saponariae]
MAPRAGNAWGTGGWLKPVVRPLEIWGLIREYTQLVYDNDSKPVRDASDAYFELREQIISSLVIVLSNERNSDYTTPLKRGEFSNPSLARVASHLYARPPIPRDHSPTSSARAQIERYFQRAEYCSACQWVQTEVLPRRHYVVWPVLLSSLNFSEPETLSDRLHQRLLHADRFDHLACSCACVQHNQYSRHEQPLRELRLAVSGQMEKLVWSLRSEVRHILGGDHFATDAIVGYKEEAPRHPFDAMRGHLAYPAGNRTTNGLVTTLFYELEPNSCGLFYDSEALTGLPSKVSTMPLDASFDEGKGVWKMQLDRFRLVPGASNR